MATHIDLKKRIVKVRRKRDGTVCILETFKCIREPFGKNKDAFAHNYVSDEELKKNWDILEEVETYDSTHRFNETA